MSCSDHLLLQRLLDGDLDDAQAELVAHHAESCARCREELKNLASLRSFVQEQLGAEDEGEQERAGAVLSAISARLPHAAEVRETRRWWRRTLVAAAGIGFLVMLLPLAFVTSVGAWSERILEKASARERMWKYQPHKTLFWEVNTVSKNVAGVTDGEWRTLFWQKNGATTLSQISRQFDPSGRLNLAYWIQPDGSTVRYAKRFGEVIEVSPSTAASREALDDMPADLRAALQAHLELRQQSRSLGHQRRRDSDWLHRPSITGGSTATLRFGTNDQWGEVYHVTVEKGASATNPSIAGSVHEYEIESTTFRLLRLKSTVTYSNGTVGVHDSRWSGFREISPAEFDAQTPSDLTSQGIPIVRLTPLAYTQKLLDTHQIATQTPRRITSE